MKHLLKFSIRAFACVFLIVCTGTTYRTIVIDGTNDFAGDEKLVGPGGSVWYFSWDADNIYLGASNPDIGSTPSSTKWVLWYIDTDPQTVPGTGTGSTQGVTYNKQQQVLPYTANYHLRWKHDDSYTDLMTFNGTSWVSADQSGITHNRTNSYLEFKVPRSVIGSPDRIYVSACMINELNSFEWTYFFTPPGQIDGWNVSNPHFYGFTLGDGVEPDDPSHYDAILPIQLSQFTATALPSGMVQLNWSTLSEVNNYGFEVQRAVWGATTFATLPSGFVPGHGTTLQKHEYVFADREALPGDWSYRLKQIDLDGSAHFTEGIRAVAQAGGTEQPLPRECSLSQNYPNPFNPTTTIRYALPRAAVVELVLYNRLGQAVETLVRGEMEAGYHEVQVDGSNLASGVYFYQIRAGDFVRTCKTLLVK